MVCGKRRLLTAAVVTCGGFLFSTVFPACSPDIPLVNLINTTFHFMARMLFRDFSKNEDDFAVVHTIHF